MSDTRGNVVWVASAKWKPGGYYHRPEQDELHDRGRTGCGIKNIAWHGSFYMESTALDDWRQPCAECWPQYKQAIEEAKADTDWHSWTPDAVR